MSCRSGKESTGGNTPGVLSLLVGPQSVDCVGVGPQLCYLVKEELEDDWTNFYAEIVGFTYEPGYNYEILVEKTKVPNPPADGAAFRYRLLKVLQKQKATSSILHDIWVVQALEGKPLKGLTNFPRMEMMPEEGRMLGFTACNDVSARLKVAPNRIAFSEVSYTEKLCPDVQDIESQFLKALDRIDRYEVKNLELFLFAGEVELMKLRKVD